MKIEFECPSCAKRLTVDGTLAGKSRSCPKCQEVIQIPRKSELTTDGDVATSEDDNETGPQKKPRTKRKLSQRSIDTESQQSWFQRQRGTIVIVALSAFAVVAIAVILLLIVQKTKEVNATPEEKEAKAQKAKE